MHLDAALLACPVNERLGESLPDALSASIAAHVHASQDTEGHRLTSRARSCRVSNDVADNGAVASSNQNRRAVVGKQPVEVGRTLSQRPRHVGLGIMHTGVLSEQQRFEFDQRFDVTPVRDLNTRHRAHRSDGREGAVDRFPISTATRVM